MRKNTMKSRDDRDASILTSWLYRRIQAVVVVLGVVYAVSTVILRAGRPLLLDTWFYSIVLIITALFALVRPLAVKRNRGAWACIALGVVSWSIGDIYWSVKFAEVDDIPVPSLADVFYVGMYPLAYAGLVLLARSTTSRLPASVWLDGVVTSLAAGAVFSAITLKNILAAASGSRLAETLTNLSYPIGDLILLVMAVAALAMVRWRRDPVWWLLGLGAAFFAVADTTYLFGIANDTYVDGSWVDGMWMLGLTFMAVAGSLDRKRSAQEVQGLAALLVPIVFSLAALFVLVLGTFVDLHPVTILLAGGCLIAAGVRTALTFEQTKALARSQLEAKTDRISGLGNRRLLDDTLPTMIAEAQHDGQQLACVIVSVDHLAEINSTLGYSAGDAILHGLGGQLRAQLPDDALSARLGGADIAVLRRVRTDASAAHGDTQILLDRLSDPIKANGIPVQMELSAGIALSPLHATDADDLIRCADDALRRAKTGRTQIEVYDEGLDVGRRFGPSLLPELVHALDDGQLVPYFQPRVNISTGLPVDLAATIRWQHPRHGLMDSDAVHALAARAGLTSRLTTVLLQSALRQCAEWRAQGSRLGVTIELSVADVLNTQLPYELAKLINSLAVPSAAVTLEIAEDVLLVDPRRTSYALGQFRRFGMRLCVDHFGRSAPSITRLRALPIHELTLDGSFIAPILHSAEDATLVRSIVGFARSLGVDAVSDGVDSNELLNAVAANGFVSAQGAAVGPLMDRLELAHWLDGAVAASALR